MIIFTSENTADDKRGVCWCNPWFNFDGPSCVPADSDMKNHREGLSRFQKSYANIDRSIAIEPTGAMQTLSEE